MKARSASQVNVQVIGTEAHYRASVDSIEIARISCGQYVDFFRSQGASNGTEVGKAALKHAVQFGDIPSGLAGVSPTTLNKRVKSGEITGQTAKAVRWIWSIETRARQMINVVKSVPSALDDVSTSTPASTPASPPASPPANTEGKALPVAASTEGKAKALPTTATVSADRSALVAILTLLEQGQANEDWQSISDASKALSALLA